jgi:hypothetical protein
MAEAFEDFDHADAGAREERVHKARDEKRDGHAITRSLFTAEKQIASCAQNEKAKFFEGFGRGRRISDESEIQTMKKSVLLLLGGSILSFNLTFAQPVNGPSVMSPPDGYVLVKITNALTKFDLDFPGGTPKDLVKAVEKATDKALNAVIPDDCANLKIPALSVKNVTVPQLFDVLGLVSSKTEHYLFQSNDANVTYEDFTDSYGFRTEGVPNDDSIWYFYWDKRSTPQKVISPTVCQFYQLGPYLDTGYKVEDITTAIETGWKMLDDGKSPEISYHKETKVLIAVGARNKVQMIDEVLKQLSKEKSSDKDLPKSKDQ